MNKGYGVDEAGPSIKRGKLNSPPESANAQPSSRDSCTLEMF